MEVEFLSNMRYSLFTSKEEWSEWHTKLGKFGTYLDKATRFTQGLSSRSFGAAPSMFQQLPTLPSPPASTNTSPPFVGSYSPHVPSISSASHPTPRTAISPMTPLSEPDPRSNGRKRSRDEQACEPPAKRLSRSFGPQGLASFQPPVSSAHAPNYPRLPLPNLSIPNTQVGQGYVPATAPSQIQTGKAMSLVYPPPLKWSTNAPPISLPYVSAGPQNDRSRHSSPYPGTPSASSPVGASFPSSASHVQNPNRLSPSHYLAERNSPYRPVRGVNTLLVPPPTSSFFDAARNIDYGQMQYQPLGRPLNERRAGPVPYMNRDAWPSTNQFNQWPALPHPNFHR